MKQEKQKSLWPGACLLAAFGLWTVLVRTVDVRSIGPQGTAVGFAAVNGWFHRLTGVRLFLYTLTDWLGLVPLAVVLAFGLLGLAQWIRRGMLRKVDRSILVLGFFYLVVLAAYAFFEVLVVNYRPVLMEGCLEASYPSSTTLLVLTVMPTAGMQLRRRLRSGVLKRAILAAITAFTLFMVLARLLSGVHWLTDILGGCLLSAGLVMLYRAMQLPME